MLVRAHSRLPWAFSLPNTKQADNTKTSWCWTLGDVSVAACGRELRSIPRKCCTQVCKQAAANLSDIYSYIPTLGYQKLGCTRQSPPRCVLVIICNSRLLCAEHQVHVSHATLPSECRVVCLQCVLGRPRRLCACLSPRRVCVRPIAREPFITSHTPRGATHARARRYTRARARVCVVVCVCRVTIAFCYESCRAAQKQSKGRR